MSGFAHRAEPGIEDPFGLNPGCLHLAAVRFRKIDGGRAHGLFAFREKRCKLLSNVRTNFVTASPDARPHRGVQVCRVCPEIADHFFYRVRHDGASSSAPASMHGGYGPCPAINQQNRNAIRCSDANASGDLVGDESITLALTIFQPVSIPHPVGVDLPQRNASFRATLARAKPVFLPYELLQRVAAIDAVTSKPE